MSEQVNTEVTPLTMADVRSWSGQEMRDKCKDPVVFEQVQTLVAEDAMKNNPSRRTEEQVKEEEEKAALEVKAAEEARAAEAVKAIEEAKAADALNAAEAAKVEADRVAAEEAARRSAPQRIIRDYQVKDENGVPIGRPTHLEAANWEEMAEKMELAHVNAVRYAERLKRQKVATKAVEVPAVQPGMSEEELVKALQDLKTKNPTEAIDVVKKFIDVDHINKTIQEANEQTQRARIQEATYSFLRGHRDDYYDVQANSDLMKDYIQTNGLAWSADNLELAFTALEAQLAMAPRESAPAVEPTPTPVPQVSAPAVVNPPVVQPPAPPVEVQKVPTAQEVAEQVLEKLLKDNPSLLDTRRGVNGGIQPGSMSGVRPATVPAARLTYEEVLKWSGDQMRAESRKPGRAAEIQATIDEHNAASAGTRK